MIITQGLLEHRHVKFVFYAVKALPLYFSARASAALQDKTPLGAAKHIAALAKSNDNPRKVIITQGAESTIVVTAGQADVLEVAVEKIAKEKIVDVNGAGDCAFSVGLYRLWGLFFAHRSCMRRRASSPIRPRLAFKSERFAWA